MSTNAKVLAHLAQSAGIREKLAEIKRLCDHMQSLLALEPVPERSKVKYHGKLRVYE